MTVLYVDFQQNKKITRLSLQQFEKILSNISNDAQAYLVFSVEYVLSGVESPMGATFFNFKARQTIKNMSNKEMRMKKEEVHLLWHMLNALDDADYEMISTAIDKTLIQFD